MLQTLAKQITEDDEITIEFNNKQLPINHMLFPEATPSIAEVYGVSTLAAIVYIMYL